MGKEIGKILTALLAVLFGVYALIKLVPSFDLAISFLSLTFGIMAIISTYRAKISLSEGTSLRDYTTYFLFSLIFIVLFSIWDTLIILFDWSGSWVIPKYFLLTVAYLIFFFTAYKIMYLGQEFGFRSQVDSMHLSNKKKGKP